MLRKPSNPQNVKRTILLFIAGMVPTTEERELAKRLQADNTTRVKFRNASQVNPSEHLEKADFVFGFVPSVYQGFPKLQLEPENQVATNESQAGLAELQAAEITPIAEPAAEPAPVVAIVNPTPPPVAEIPAAPVAPVAVSKTKPAKETKSGKKTR